MKKMTLDQLRAHINNGLIVELKSRRDEHESSSPKDPTTCYGKIPSSLLAQFVLGSEQSKDFEVYEVTPPGMVKHIVIARVDHKECLEWSAKVKGIVLMPKVDLHDYALIREYQYDQQKALPKKEFLKTKPGDILEVKWKDGPNTRAMVLHPIHNHAGDVDIEVFEFQRNRVYDVYHDQVIANYGRPAGL